MPHIHTKPGQHDLTTTAFIIRTDGDEPRGLLHVHRKLDMLLPVGGHVELDETPWAAIIHEVREESGYEISQLDILQPQERITRMDGVKIHPVPLFLQTHEFKKDEGHSHVDIGFLFITNQLPAKLPGDGESSNLIWLNAEELDARRHEMPADIAQIYEFSFDIALPRWERVSPETFDV